MEQNNNITENIIDEQSNTSTTANSVNSIEELKKIKEEDRIQNKKLTDEITEQQPILFISDNEIYNGKAIVDDKIYTTEYKLNDDVKTESTPNKILQNSFTPDLLAIPNWNLADFLEERKKYIFKGLPSLAESKQLSISDKRLYKQDEKGYFFYKVFFNFYTGYGLLGGLINNANINPNLKDVPSFNTAINYLKVNSNSNRFSEVYRKKLFQKCLSLKKFGELLNYLMVECPWYFKEIGGIQEAIKYDFDDLTKERKITLTFNPDAIDFRVSALMELYLDACFDPYNHKEIVPSNLRKFDMSVLICQVPIIGHNIFGTTHHGFNLDTNNNYLDTLSFKWILFQNCEFDYKSIASVVDSVSSESPFEMSHTVDIIAERTYVRDFNPDLNLMDIFSYMPNLY